MNWYFAFWHGNTIAAILLHGCIVLIIAEIIHEKIEDSRYQVPMNKGKRNV